MTTFPSTYGSTAISDTGLDYVPNGIPLNGNGTWHRLPIGHSNGTMSMKDEPPAGPGHNSKIRRSNWYTPSKQSFDEAAAANAGPGRNLHRLHVLQVAVFDSRLGVCPIPVKLLVAVMGYGNRETGAAHPGTRILAEEIYQDLQKLPPEERAAALDKAVSVIMNMFTLLKQCGYDVSIRRAPADGGHAVAHHALTYPEREEMLAAIPIHQQWQEQENARKADAKKKPGAAREVSSPNAAHEVTDLTRRMRSEGADLTRTTVSDLTRRQENSALHSITEPKKEPDTPLPPKGGAGADAPVDATLPFEDDPAQYAGEVHGKKDQTNPPRTASSDLDAAFEEFWKAFPPGRKVDKGDTRDLFKQIVSGKHKKRRAPASVIIEAAKRYAATKPDPQYTPKPMTWLTGGRWEDDICQPKTDGATDGRLSAEEWAAVRRFDKKLRDGR